MSKGFFVYRDRFGKQYAYFCHSFRIKGKPLPIKNETYLGVVVDKDKHIFHNRERGDFMFDKEKGYIDVPSSVKTQLAISRLSGVIDFGDSWIVHEILSRTGYIDVIKNICPEKSDSILALLSFKLLGHGLANKLALNRFNYSYAKILYPTAKLSSKKIDGLLYLLGFDESWQQFYIPHLQYISKRNHEQTILIDSTFIPDFKINLKQISNYKGKVSNEIRLIVALDRITNMPIYFRYVVENLFDVSTLKTTIDEIESFGINIKDIIFDAGYFSDNNIRKLHDVQIPYLIKLPARGNLYNDLIENHLPNINDVSDNVSCLNNKFFAKSTQIYYLGKNFYAYVIIDIKKRAIDSVEYLKNTRKKGFSKEEINAKLKEMGAFVLLSNKEIPLDEIIPLYYTRQSIEELLPLTKNHANTLPVRVQSENIFKGNLLISFIASAALLIINDYIKELNISTVELFEYFYTIKAIVNNDQLIICEGNQEASEIIEKFKLKFPDNTIMMSNSRQSDIIE